MTPKSSTSKKIITSQRSSFHFYLKEIWAYRGLLWTLTYRDLRIRYAQTYLGFIWLILQPLTTLLIFSLVFGIAIKVDTGGIPYPVFAFAGLFAWNYFSGLVSQGGESILNAQGLITKVYFPKIILPLSKAIVVSIDFFINFLLMVIILIWYQYAPPSNVWFLPVWLLTLIIASLGVSIGLSALSIQFRDFQPIAKFSLQVGFYLTPIAYPSQLIPTLYHPLYYCNPMAGIVEGFRWSIIGGQVSPYIYISVGVTLILFITSLWYFRRVEQTMADIV
ncbi:phosphate ABC transporter permease [marine bacterium AO1-C]|nr:phosphate ABC transporter permease [marine bacterium AO1-C]